MENSPGGFYDEKSIEEQFQQSMKRKMKRKNFFRNIGYGRFISGIIGVIVGLVFIVVGIWAVYDASQWSYSYSEQFGGDAYTYIYNGIVHITRAMPKIGRLLGWIIMTIGGAICVTSLRSLLVGALDNKSSHMIYAQGSSEMVDETIRIDSAEDSV